ncbi:hypothetical protein EEI45_04980 [Erysipelothrix piscisicarius]|uniref:Prepilin type IV endopeptidase peptidase domain-containing protein n=1 Tax=Erysipelothrix piscisicarius TaxID=2485784 RepID=A0A3S8RMK3_9FIRM|nr:hypothetical protein EEI45_04980 [Erysipelothrix piscisicarius]
MVIETTNTLLVVILVLLSYFDFKLLKIPKCFIYLIYILRIICPIPITIDNFISSIVFGLPFYLCYRFRASIGYGDVLLIEALCFYSGMQKSIMGIYYMGFVAFFFLCSLILRRQSLEEHYPFVPIISIGFFLAL